MQLWLAVKNLLPLHTVPAQTAEPSNMSKFPSANDVFVGNLNVTHDPCRPRSHNRNPILAIPVYGVVLERGAALGAEDRHASTGVPVNNVVTHRTRRRQHIVD